jgi:hypothetical protein
LRVEKRAGRLKVVIILSILRDRNTLGDDEFLKLTKNRMAHRGGLRKYSENGFKNA